jgi:hypothetical protein
MRHVPKTGLVFSILALSVLALCVVPGWITAPAAQGGSPSDQNGAEKHFSIPGERLVLADLIGKIEVKPADGTDFVIDVTIRGKDATADRIRFDQKAGGDAHFYIQFPDKDADRFVYPRLEGSTTIMSPNSRPDRKDNLLDWVLPGRHKTIRVSGEGNGLEIWADVVVRVPRGRALDVRHGVGEILANGTTGKLDLDNNSGPVSAQGIQGDVVIDTGSGNVRVGDITGDLSVDTGSGDVDASRCKGVDFHIDTGSGTVQCAEIDCKKILIDTGSGDVEGAGVSADNGKIDTGSGSVSVSFDRIGSGPFVVDTGSGDVTVKLPSDANARITAETGSGDIVSKLSNARVTRKSSDELAMTVGKGDARFSIDTGSGDVRIGGK